jgi:hypothetical protein
MGFQNRVGGFEQSFKAWAGLNWFDALFRETLPIARKIQMTG